MAGGTRLAAIGLLAATAVALAGCGQSEERLRYSPPTRAALFGPNEGFATRIARSEWPATTGRYQSPEDQVYVQYYFDFQGNAASQASYPITTFRSYRVGSAVQR